MKYFLADPHIGHKKVIFGMYRHDGNKYFSTTDEHDEALIDAINFKVKRHDQLYLLGDVGFHPSPFRAAIKCKNVTLIRGNHDKHVASMHAFGGYHDILKVKLVNGCRCILCHYPIIYWEGSHNNTYHLYGHCHGNRETTLDSLFRDRKSMDVTVDNLYQFGIFGPISEEQVIDILSSKPGHDPKEFYTRLQKARDEEHKNNTQS